MAAKKPASDAPEQPDGTIPIEQAARLLMISAERVRQLIKAGFIPRPKPGRTTLVGAVQGYIKFRDDADRRANKSAAESDVRKERAREIKLRNDARERALIPIDEALAEYDTLVAKVREAMDSIPARVTRDIQLRRKIEAEVHAAKENILKALGRSIDAARTGRPSDGSAAD